MIMYDIVDKIRAETTTVYSWFVCFFGSSLYPTIAGIGSSTHVTLSAG